MIRQIDGCGKHRPLGIFRRMLKSSTICSSFLPVSVFLFFSLLFGSYFIYFFGALTIPDVTMHALGAYSLASGQSFNSTIEYSDSNSNPKRTQILTGDSRYLLLTGNRENLISSLIAGQFPKDQSRDAQIDACNETGREMQIPYDESTGVTLMHNRSNQYFPLAWLPQSVGIRIGLMLNANPYSTWQLGGITGFIFYLAAFSVSIFLIPKMKSIIAAIGCLPFSIFCGCSLMCDAFILELVTISTAFLINRITLRNAIYLLDTIIIGIMAGILAMVKIVYVPAAMGFIIVPNKQLSIRNKLTAVAIIVFCAAIYLFWSRSIGDMAIKYDLENNTNLFFTMLPAVLLRIIYSIASMPLLLNNLGNEYLVFVIILLAILSINLCRNNTNTAKALSGSSWRYVVGAAIACFISLSGIFAFLLLTWNDLSLSSFFTPIDGFQGRYLLPLLPLLCFFQTLSASPEVEDKEAVK